MSGDPSDCRFELCRVSAYLWAAPTTVLGLLLVPVAILTGGAAVWRDGVLEVHGRSVRWLLRHMVPVRGGADALTLGHVVIGCDRASLDATREHERRHVRQCETWGPLFVPAYVVASLWAWTAGLSPYRDNFFERQARGDKRDPDALRLH